MTADLIMIGKVLGIPGVVVLCWYLLESRKSDREKAKEAAQAERDRANDKRNAALERMRIDAENKRTAAMEEGFMSLGRLMAAHTQTEAEDHSEQNERLAGIESVLEIKRRRNTPATGTTIREINRARTNGGDR
jgi:multidrug efflux pump subunit AcrA (membrane-fusion protein)